MREKIVQKLYQNGYTNIISQKKGLSAVFPPILTESGFYPLILKLGILPPV